MSYSKDGLLLNCIDLFTNKYTLYNMDGQV